MTATQHFCSARWRHACDMPSRRLSSPRRLGHHQTQHRRQWSSRAHPRAQPMCCCPSGRRGESCSTGRRVYASPLSLSRLAVNELVPRQAQQRRALTDVHVHKVLPVAVYRPPHVGVALVLAAAAARAGSRGGGLLGGGTLHSGFVRGLVAAGEEGKAWSHTCFVHTSP